MVKGIKPEWELLEKCKFFERAEIKEIDEKEKMQSFCNFENGSFPRSTVNESDHDDPSTLPAKLDETL